MATYCRHPYIQLRARSSVSLRSGGSILQSKAGPFLTSGEVFQINIRTQYPSSCAIVGDQSSGSDDRRFWSLLIFLSGKMNPATGTMPDPSAGLTIGIGATTIDHHGGFFLPFFLVPLSFWLLLLLSIRRVELPEVAEYRSELEPQLLPLWWEWAIPAPLPHLQKQ